MLLIRIGWHPATIRGGSANAVQILAKIFGIDASAPQSRDIRNVDLKNFDLVIAIENNAAAVVEGLGVADCHLQVWPIRDPWGAISLPRRSDIRPLPET
jgi:protein-tyrosine-phosphatase